MADNNNELIDNIKNCCKKNTILVLIKK